jgi:hypothetical protein
VPPLSGSSSPRIAIQENRVYLLLGMGDEGSGWPERVTKPVGVVLKGTQCTGWMGVWERTLRCGNTVKKIN